MKKYFAIAVLSALMLPSIAAASDGSGKSSLNNHCYFPVDDRHSFQVGHSESTGHVTGQATDMLLFGQLASALVGVAGFFALRRREGEARS